MSEEINKTELIKLVREQTGFPLSECTKILKEAEWNIEKLEALLPKFKTKIASKKQDRETTEGQIFAKKIDNQLYYILLSCETDFVSSNALFAELGEKYLHKFINNESEEEKKDLIDEYISKISENITLSKAEIFKCNDYYLYKGKKLAAIESNCEDKDFSKQLCLHIISMAEVYEMDSVESFLQQKWFLNESKTIEEILKENSVIVKNIMFFC